MTISATSAGARAGIVSTAPHCDQPALMVKPPVLLVGGNHPLVAMLTEHLHGDGRYEVETVAYCDHALAMLERRRFDLVLVLSAHVPWTMWPNSFSLEWRANLINAVLFLKHMRTLPNSPPVILVSGSPLLEVQNEALANGAFAFIAKPVALMELDRFVELALESRKRDVGPRSPESALCERTAPTPQVGRNKPPFDCSPEG